MNKRNELRFCSDEYKSYSRYQEIKCCRLIFWEMTQDMDPRTVTCSVRGSDRWPGFLDPPTLVPSRFSVRRFWSCSGIHYKGYDSFSESVPEVINSDDPIMSQSTDDKIDEIVTPKSIESPGFDDSKFWIHGPLTKSKILFRCFQWNESTNRYFWWRKLKISDDKIVLPSWNNKIINHTSSDDSWTANWFDHFAQIW